MQHLYLIRNNMNKELKFALELNNCTLIDGWTDAVIGITHSDKPKAVYSVSKCIALIKIKENITFEEAEEFFIYNQLKGEDAPIFVALNQDLSSDVDYYRLTDAQIQEMYSR